MTNESDLRDRNGPNDCCWCRDLWGYDRDLEEVRSWPNVLKDRPGQGSTRAGCWKSSSGSLGSNAKRWSIHCEPFPCENKQTMINQQLVNIFHGCMAIWLLVINPLLTISDMEMLINGFVGFEWMINGKWMKSRVGEFSWASCNWGRRWRLWWPYAGMILQTWNVIR